MRSEVYWEFILVLALAIYLAKGCQRKPQGASGERSPADDSFQILIEGNPSTYIPGQQYNVSISCAPTMKFISFTLVVEGMEASSGLPIPTYDTLGHFELLDLAETTFSSTCENMIESTNTNVKSRVDVAWVAPTSPESGCVTFKAVVVQHRNVWFMDDGFLSKRLCPEEIDEVNSQTPPVNPCCACDEAKYEIVLERRWTRNTHAKDYPSEVWRTRFSQIIGASHVHEFRFWDYGSLASRGLKEMAEHGSTKNLEAEIKAHINAGSIRTIIKAPGINYRPNAYGTTLAHVRVDPQHHLISLVTKIFPSPDWILGVAGLELCLANCTWIDRKVLNLYPWDIGTDAGPSYMSADQPQIPPDVIRRITSMFPSDYRSPFYDETGAPMKPLATLYITKKKLYERVCNEDENLPVECSVHPWNSWSECSAKCGPGMQYRQRAYKDDRLAASFKCQMELHQEQNCMGEECGELANSPLAQTPECELGMWTGWSVCSKRCGKGVTTRKRDYIFPYNREKCQSAIPVELEQQQECFGNDCGGSIRNSNDYGINRRPSPPEEYEEPGLLEETPYPAGAGRFGGQMPGSRQPIPNINNRFPLPNNFDDVGLPDNLYGSEKFTGYPANKFNRLTKADEEARRFGASNERDSQVTGPLGFDQFPKQFNQFGETYGSYSTTRSPFPSLGPGYGGRVPPFGPNPRFPFQTSDQGEFPGNSNSMDGASEPGFSVVQEYCFQKPVASEEPCTHSKVIISNYWFYDAEDRECKIFTTDNCDENKNRFRTLEACEGTCHRPQMMNSQEQVPFETKAGGWETGFGQPQAQTRSRPGNQNKFNRKFN